MSEQTSRIQTYTQSTPKQKAADRRRFIQLMGAGTLGVAAGLSGNSVMAQQTRGIEGRKAPELDFDYWIDGEGEPTQFSVLESKGKWVFLKCFQNWCPGCHSSGFPTLKAFSDEFYGHPKVAIAAVQTVFEGYKSNTQEAVRELQLRYDLPVPMGHNPGNSETHEMPSTMLNYRTGGTPWLILINPEGLVVYNGFHVDTEKLITYMTAQLA